MVKKLCVILIVLALCGNTWAEEESVKVAKLNFYEIQPLLIDLVLSRPENKDLKTKYQAHKEKERIRGEEWMKKSLQAHKTGELKIPMPAGAYDFEGYETEKKVTDLAKAELIRIIQEIFKGQYQLIIQDPTHDVIIYTNIAISDITPNVRQYLMRTKTSEGDKKE